MASVLAQWIAMLAVVAVQEATPAPAPAAKSPDVEAPAGMVWIAGGEFVMGSARGEGQPDESPQHRVELSGYFIDATEVTNAQFRAFVKATGYVTTAERAPDLAEIMK